MYVTQIPIVMIVIPVLRTNVFPKYTVWCLHDKTDKAPKEPNIA